MKALTNPMREKVSLSKKRYVADSFNLDLSYITDNVIAMGFPSEGIEATYRNKLSEIKRFLDHFHLNRYMVYNLCSERVYIPSKFDAQVRCFPFPDHNPPPLYMIHEFCVSVDWWLSLHEENIAAVHCKAGKGRAGVLVCCYLLHSKYVKDADAAMELFGDARTSNGKGVTIPSQRRYIKYYEHILKSPDRRVLAPKLYIKRLQISNIPGFLKRGIMRVNCKSKKFSTKVQKSNMDSRKIAFNLSSPIPIDDDTYISILAKDKGELFSFWFNTAFVDEDLILVLEKNDLDKPQSGKDKLKGFDEKTKVYISFMDEKQYQLHIMFNPSDGRKGSSPPLEVEEEYTSAEEDTDAQSEEAELSESEEEVVEKKPKSKKGNGEKAKKGDEEKDGEKRPPKKKGENGSSPQSPRRAGTQTKPPTSGPGSKIRVPAPTEGGGSKIRIPVSPRKGFEGVELKHPAAPTPKGKSWIAGMSKSPAEDGDKITTPQKGSTEVKPVIPIPKKPPTSNDRKGTEVKPVIPIPKKSPTAKDDSKIKPKIEIKQQVDKKAEKPKKSGKESKADNEADEEPKDSEQKDIKPAQEDEQEAPKEPEKDEGVKEGSGKGKKAKQPKADGKKEQSDQEGSKGTPKKARKSEAKDEDKDKQSSKEGSGRGKKSQQIKEDQPEQKDTPSKGKKDKGHKESDNKALNPEAAPKKKEKKPKQPKEASTPKKDKKDKSASEEDSAKKPKEGDKEKGTKVKSPKPDKKPRLQTKSMSQRMEKTKGADTIGEKEGEGRKQKMSKNHRSLSDAALKKEQAKGKTPKSSSGVVNTKVAKNMKKDKTPQKEKKDKKK